MYIQKANRPSEFALFSRLYYNNKIVMILLDTKDAH